MRPNWIARFVLVLSIPVAFGQHPEYDFYAEFRECAQQQRRADRTLSAEQMLVRYSGKLRGQGIAAAEIQRRLTLVKTTRDQLEDDFWNRFFTQGKQVFNPAPNAFLTEVVQSRKPGTALDYGMGEGRNALFLAKLGWQVSGFDPAADAVALAQKRACLPRGGGRR